MSQPFEEFPLQSALDATILMHRDVHFGGNFNLMLKYYEEGGKGISDEFDEKQVRKLAEFERAAEENIAPSILTGSDAEKVAEAKKAYQQLKDLFEEDSKDLHYPQLIASLILSEDEDPQEEIEAIIKEKEAIVPSLLEVLKSERFYDPLFPGYGQAPQLVAQCLGLIGDKRAIISLFEGIGQGDFFHDDILLKAMKEIGDSAKQFLLKIVKSQPINEDNERAAIALNTFKEDPEVAETCFDLLEFLSFNPNLPITHYLIFACEGLQNPSKRESLVRLLENPKLSKDLVLDLRTIMEKWS